MCPKYDTPYEYLDLTKKFSQMRKWYMNNMYEQKQKQQKQQKRNKIENRKIRNNIL